MSTHYQVNRPSIADTSTNTFYFKKQLVYFHVGKGNIFVYWREITLDCPLLSTIIGDRRLAESHDGTIAEQNRAGGGAKCVLIDI